MQAFHKSRVVKKKAGRVKRLGRKANFTTVEDSGMAAVRLRKIASTAVRQAAHENRRHGLAAIVIRGNQVIKVDNNKIEEVLSTLEKSRHTYRAGQVFYARKG
jgi:hypothetical protein